MSIRWCMMIWVLRKLRSARTFSSCRRFVKLEVRGCQFLRGSWSFGGPGALTTPGLLLQICIVWLFQKRALRKPSDIMGQWEEPWMAAHGPSLTQDCLAR